MDEFWKALCVLFFLWLGLITLGVVLASTDQAGGWSPATFPNPHVDPEQCGRREASWVCDPDRMMLRQSRDRVQALITSISTECRHPCNGGESGYQVAVAIVRRLNGTVPGADNSQAVADFAAALYQRWGLNQSGCDDGVLLLIVTSHTFVYILPGNGTQDVLTPWVVPIIARRAREDWEKRFDEAVIDAVRLMRDAFQGKDISMAPPTIEWVILLGFVAWMALLPLTLRAVDILIHLIIRLLRPFVRCICFFWDAVMAVPRTLRKMRQKLGRIQRELEGLQQGAGFTQRMCPICLEDFPDPIETPAAATPLMATTVQRLGCSHRYHAACLRGWLEHSDALTCPLCRETIDLDDLNGPQGPNQTYRAWLRYYLSRLYSQNPMQMGDPENIEAHVDHLVERRGTDWAATGVPDAMTRAVWIPLRRPDGAAGLDPGSQPPPTTLLARPFTPRPSSWS